ncbi:MAG: DUF5103 domain-containing protein [Ferruginibacter sp.]
MHLFKYLPLAAVSSLLIFSLQAQKNPEAVFKANIQAVRFHVAGDQLALPVYKLKSNDRLELNFDDMDVNVKSYYYTYQLCDFDWQPVQLSPFDYIKGFTQQRITNYRFSSIAYTRYTHYQVILPEANSLPTRSGNYLLKVFLDGDTTKLAFTRAMLVLDPKSSVAAQFVQPFAPQYFKTHQRLKFTVNLEGLNAFSANQQVKVLVLQNNRWDNAQGSVPPTFVRGNGLEYNSENNFVFPGGKEWRWLDLRSFHLQSERVEKADYSKTATKIYVKPDIDLTGQRYIYYQDLNGLYQVITFESINPYWQGDFATVQFSFVTPSRVPYPGKDLYLFGQLTDYKLNDAAKMQFNSEKGMYEGTQFLKQGYYSYGYMLVDRNDPAQRSELEGNYWETENTYTILVYYKSFTDQSDQLIGIGKLDTRSDRAGISF